MITKNGNNQEIRSKATLQKGKIIHITSKSIWVDFGYKQPIKLSYEKFLELIYCDQELENEIRRALDEIRDIRVADEDT